MTSLPARLPASCASRARKRRNAGAGNRAGGSDSLPNAVAPRAALRHEREDVTDEAEIGERFIASAAICRTASTFSCTCGRCVDTSR